VTIELTDVPEQQALETLLRSASGYMLAPRAVPAPNLAQFDRIIRTGSVNDLLQRMEAQVSNPSGGQASPAEPKKARGAGRE
jgi:hypothetical protein